MRLIDSSKTEDYQATGAWGRVPLDVLVQKAAHGHPDTLALVDANDRAEWTGGAPRRLTYGELEWEIGKAAATFAALGLENGSVIGLFAGNTTDTIINFLAILRAGFIVAPVPLTWRGAEIEPAFDLIGARAFVASDRLEDAPLAEIARDAAIELFGVRYVLGVGDALPDGVASLAGIHAAGTQDTAAPVVTADDVATVTWTIDATGGPVPVPRSHNQWIATGLMHLLEGRIDRGAVLHSAYAPTGIVGIGAVLIPWLLSGGTLHLHHFRDLDGLASEIATTSADIAVLPEGLVDAVAARLDAMDAALPSISAVWRATPPASAGPGAFSRRAAVDLIPIGEFALVASPRDRDTAAAIPIGPVIAPRGTPGGPVLVETRLVGRQQRAGNTDDTLLTGEIAVSGAMVPDIGWPGGRAPAIVTDDAGFVLTGATARPLDTDPPSAAIAGHGRERAVTGGLAVNLAELDHLLIEGTAHAAAAFAVPDPILGERLRAAIVTDDGDAFDPAALKAFLAERRTGLHKMPSAITAVAALPEHPDGTVDRAALKKSASG